MIKDRDYQTKAVDAAIGYLQSGGKAGLISSATGTGKSVIIAKLIKRVLGARSDINILVCTHVSELVEQNAKKMVSIMPGSDIGIFSAGLGMKQKGRQITFAGIQSIFRHEIQKIHFLIIDEAHSIPKKGAGMWLSFIGRLREDNPNLKIIGLSATTFRMDSGNLTSGEDALFDEVIFDYGLGRAVQDGWLAPLVGKGTKTVYDVSRVGKLAGEYNLKELEAATNIDSLTKQTVEESIKLARGRRSWLAFCNGIPHSFAVRDEMRRQGITCETVTGTTPDNERMQILEDFKRGSIQCVTNNAVWTTGIDVPDLDVIIMLRHTLSGGLLSQMAGRGTRTVIDLSIYQTAKERREAISVSSKPNCLFLDFAGNIQRHGFLDQIKGKDKGEKGDGVAPMKFCEECATICHAAARKCPDCGYLFPVNEKEGVVKLHNGQVMSGGSDFRPVKGVEYTPHNLDREGKTPSLMVKYFHPDLNATREYICLEHTNFAGTKARKWWKDRGGKDISGMTVNQIYRAGMCDELMVPDFITVTKDGKFDRIVKYGDLKAPIIQDNIGDFKIEDMDDWDSLTV